MKYSKTTADRDSETDLDTREDEDDDSRETDVPPEGDVYDVITRRIDALDCKRGSR